MKVFYAERKKSIKWDEIKRKNWRKMLCSVLTSHAQLYGIAKQNHNNIRKIRMNKAETKTKTKSNNLCHKHKSTKYWYLISTINTIHMSNNLAGRIHYLYIPNHFFLTGRSIYLVIFSFFSLLFFSLFLPIPSYFHSIKANIVIFDRISVKRVFSLSLKSPLYAECQLYTVNRYYSYVTIKIVTFVWINWLCLHFAHTIQHSIWLLCKKTFFSAK